MTDKIKGGAPVPPKGAPQPVNASKSPLDVRLGVIAAHGSALVVQLNDGQVFRVEPEDIAKLNTLEGRTAKFNFLKEQVRLFRLTRELPVTNESIAEFILDGVAGIDLGSLKKSPDKDIVVVSPKNKSTPTTATAKNSISGAAVRNKIAPPPTPSPPASPLKSKAKTAPDNVQDLIAFVQKNRTSVRDGVLAAAKKGDFLLIGERHYGYGDGWRSEVAATMSALRSEGFTCFGIEIQSQHQAVIDSVDPNGSPEQLASLHLPDDWVKMIFAAKRAGMKVLCIDQEHNGNRRATAATENARDSHMMDRIQNTVEPGDKMVIFIGSAHVAEKSIESYDDGPVARIGARLAGVYGSSKVVSISFASRRDSIDHLFISDAPRYSDLLPPGDGRNFMMPNVNAFARGHASAFDYVIVGE